MILGPPPEKYSAADQAAMREAVQREDQRNQKADQDYRLDAGQRLVLKDEVTGDLYRFRIESGVLSIAAFG